ncbi:DUF3987 domain-containing protein [Rhodococcus opacus]|uniref:DUF3987 domain-containing protein n=1 Tax=Rhodococcus opacus TaxID=37919 RepID=UPI00155AB7F0|nr:DUF3987 domain-containing protein [Rhodococcus opacus]
MSNEGTTPSSIRLGDAIPGLAEEARAHQITEALALASKGWKTPDEFGAVVDALTAADLFICLVYPPETLPRTAERNPEKTPVSRRHCLTPEQQASEEFRGRDAVDLATNDPQRIADMTVEFIRHFDGKLPNLGVHLHPSRLLVADYDTPAQTEAYKNALRFGDRAAYATDAGPTVETPGLEEDGMWKHSDGGHSYFVLPEGVDGASADIPVPGSAEKWKIIGSRGLQVLLPGSRRTEGPYVHTGAEVGVAGPWLLDKIAGRANARTSRKVTAPAAGGARTAPAEEGDTGLDNWARAHSWGELLIPDGWKETGPGGCGPNCMQWQHPYAASGRSAITHGEDCTEGYTPGSDGAYPLYLFSDSHPDLESGRAYTRAQYAVDARYGGDWPTFHGAEDTSAYENPTLTSEGQKLAGGLWPGTSEEWGPLDPFRAPPPPLPLDGLPNVLRQFVLEAAEALQVPTDLVLNHALGALSSAPYGTLQCQIRPGWVVPLNLAVMTLAKSGELKSPLNSVVMKPFDKIETERRDRDREAALDRAADIAALSTKLDQVKRTLTSGKSSAAGSAPAPAPASPGGPGFLSGVLAASSAFAEVATLEREIMRLKGKFLRWSSVMDDATPEAVGVRLGDTHTGAALMRSDETNIFSQIAGQARNGGGTEKAKVYLHGVSGDPIRTDRLGRDEVYVERPSLSLALMMQPEVFEATIRTSPQLVDIGIVPRLLIVRPASKVGGRKSDPAPMSSATEDGWSTAIRAISDSAEAHVNRVLAGRIADAETSGKTVPVRQVDARLMTVNAAGWELLRAYKERIEPELGKGGRLEPVRSWGSKSTAYIAQIAALLTLLDDPAALEVDNNYIVTAEKLMDGYALHHLALAEVPTEAAAEAIWSRVGDLDDSKFDAEGFIKLTAVRKLIQNQAWFKNADMRDRDELLRDALATLEARGYVKIDRTGRRDSLKIKRRPDTK